MANGAGRLIHTDGSMYEGLWFNNNAHGLGVFIQLDSASYTGEWNMD